MITKIAKILSLIATLLSGCDRAETQKHEEMPTIEVTTLGGRLAVVVV